MAFISSAYPLLTFTTREFVTTPSLLFDRSQFEEFVDGQPLKAVINLEAQAK
jgi:hypothetical protein